jgi:hypothetical protein
MKRFPFSFALCSLLVLIACGKKATNPVSFVDGYQPQYLAAKGTTFSGEYCPLIPGSSCLAEGTGNQFATNNISTRGQGISKDTITRDSSLNFPISFMTFVEPQQTIQVAGKACSVVPLRGISYATSNGIPDTSEMTNFYEITDSAIFTRAMSEKTTAGFDTVTFENAISLKRPLVVGDHWESSPTADLSSLGTAVANGTKNLQEHGISFVVGPDTILVKGEKVATIRIDQVVEESFSMSDSGTVLNMTVDILSVSYLEKDTGEVKAEMTMNTNMDIVSSANGVSTTSNVSVNLSTSAELVSYGLDSTALSKRTIETTGTSLRKTRTDLSAGSRPFTKLQRKALMRAMSFAKALLY